jgi:hypothetical protein
MVAIADDPFIAQLGQDGAGETAAWVNSCIWKEGDTYLRSGWQIPVDLQGSRALAGAGGVPDFPALHPP